MSARQLFGPSESEITTAHGEFVCPLEQKPATYEVRRSQRRFAVLGVRVSTSSRETISCSSCGAVFEPASVAEHMRGPAQPGPPGVWPAPTAAEPTTGLAPAPESATRQPRAALSPDAQVSPAAPASPGPTAPFVPPPPGITPRVIAPGAVVSGQRRVAPPPPSALQSRVSQAPSAAPRAERESAAPPVSGDKAPRHVAPPPWAAPDEAPSAAPSPGSEINEKTRITTRSPRRKVRWQLVGSDGAVIEIDGTIVIGRDPSSELIAGATVVSIADKGRSMSKSHAALTATDDGLFVEDLHSTNGVRIVRGTEEAEIQAGARVRLRAGEMLLLGDCEFGVDINPAP
jgi:hypothetical protein